MFGNYREKLHVATVGVLKILEVVHCQFDLVRCTKASLFTIQSWRNFFATYVLTGMWNAKGVVDMLTMNRSTCRRAYGVPMQSG